jgi:hypothetical protein
MLARQTWLQDLNFATRSLNRSALTRSRDRRFPLRPLCRVRTSIFFCCPDPTLLIPFHGMNFCSAWSLSPRVLLCAPAHFPQRQSRFERAPLTPHRFCLLPPLPIFLFGARCLIFFLVRPKPMWACHLGFCGRRPVLTPTALICSRVFIFGVSKISFAISSCSGFVLE